MNTDEMRGMFARVAGKYDVINRIMSFGRDTHWRAEAVKLLDIKEGDRILDIGSGTGDLAILAVEDKPGIQVVACDLTMEMVNSEGTLTEFNN